jgi:drug/metabolite transporter (DMT)-like permease
MISAFAFKERLSKKQWIGIAIGVISALLMNLK